MTRRIKGKKKRDVRLACRVMILIVIMLVKELLDLRMMDGGKMKKRVVYYFLGERNS